MSVKRRNEMVITDLNMFDPDTSVDMFYGKFVKSFPHPRGGEDISFIYRRIDPGTLLELTDVALFAQPSQSSDASAEPSAEPSLSPAEQLRIAKVRRIHRLEVLQKCICEPKFKNLEQIDTVPMDWQISLYNLIMHSALGGDCLTATRFPEEGQAASA